MQTIAATLLVGIIATAIFDIWGQIAARIVGMPRPAWGLPGRWFAACARGHLRHDTIADAAPVANEAAIGWAGHYLIGIAYAAAVVLIAGPGWLAAPTLAPALVVGIVTVAAGWFFMAPCMGFGIASSRTARPWTLRAMQIVAHVVFGLGLYLGGLVAAALL